MKYIVNLSGVVSLVLFLLPSAGSGSTLGQSYFLFGFNESSYDYSESAPPHTYEISPTYYYFTPPPSIPDREYGATSAFHAEGKFYSHDRALPWYGGFLFEYGGGIQTYNGTALDSIQVGVPGPGDTTQYFPPIVESKSNTFTRIGGFIGPYFKVGNTLVGLNAGLLYYNWYRGAGAYNESYSWVYLPVGAEVQWEMNDRLSVGLDMQYRIMLSGSMTATYDYATVLEGVPTAANNFTLGTRDGFYLGFPMQLQIDRWFGLEWKPWFELRPSGISGLTDVNPETGSGYLEPNSYSYSIGVSISAMFGTFSSFDRTH
jgi:hypothetical protein